MGQKLVANLQITNGGKYELGQPKQQEGGDAKTNPVFIGWKKGGQIGPKKWNIKKRRGKEEEGKMAYHNRAKFQNLHKNE
jgi:hypothetical protein